MGTFPPPSNNGEDIPTTTEHTDALLISHSCFTSIKIEILTKITEIQMCVKDICNKCNKYTWAG